MKNHFDGVLEKKNILGGWGGGANGLFWALQMNHFQLKHDAF